MRLSFTSLEPQNTIRLDAKVTQNFQDRQTVLLIYLKLLSHLLISLSVDLIVILACFLLRSDLAKINMTREGQIKGIRQ